MPTTDTNVPQVVVNKLTKAQYETATKSPTEFYVVSDEQIGTSDIADGAVTAAKASFTTYSTSEQVVGTWIDGKPLYRKTFSITYARGTATLSVASGLSGIDVKTFNAVFRKGSLSSTDIEGPYYNSASDFFRAFYRTGNNTIELRSGTTSADGEVIINIEYTKTSD